MSNTVNAGFESQIERAQEYESYLQKQHPHFLLNMFYLIVAIGACFYQAHLVQIVWPLYVTPLVGFFTPSIWAIFAVGFILSRIRQTGTIAKTRQEITMREYLFRIFNQCVIDCVFGTIGMWALVAAHHYYPVHSILPGVIH